MRKPAKKIDGRRNNGGVRKGAGRPTKQNEEELLSRLRPLDDLAIETLKKNMKKGDYQFWNKFMEYRYGKPNDNIDITTGGQPFNMPIVKFFDTDESK